MIFRKQLLGIVIGLAIFVIAYAQIDDINTLEFFTPSASYDLFLGDSLFKYVNSEKEFDTLYFVGSQSSSKEIFVVHRIKNELYRITKYSNKGRKVRETYRNVDARLGYDIKWDHEGNLIWVGQFNIPKGYINDIKWHKNGQLKKFSLTNDLDNSGFISKYDQSGMLEEMVELIPFTEDGCNVNGYYNNGKIACTTTYNMGKQLYTEYYKNGVKAREGYIYNLDLIRVGIWQEWDEEGNLIREDDYGEDHIPSDKRSMQ